MRSSDKLWAISWCCIVAIFCGGYVPYLMPLAIIAVCFAPTKKESSDE